MRFVICISCIALLALVTMATGSPTTSGVSKPSYKLENAPALFEKFIKDFNKEYKDDADRKVHYEAFVKSLETINKLNSEEKGSATFDINNFADFTDEERKRMRGIRID